MSINNQQNSDNKREAGGYSYAEEHSILYTWKINKITSFLESAGSTEKPNFIVSPSFSTGAKLQDLWCFEIKIDKDEESPKKKSWVSVYLMPKNGNRRVRTKYLAFILNNKKEKVINNFLVYDQLLHKEYIINYIFEGSQLGNGFSHFVKIDELLEKKDEFFPDDILTVGVDLTVYDNYVKINDSINSSKAPKRKLSNDFEDLFATKKKCDIKIQVGRRVFDAHKLILSTRSCVFDAMFSHNMKENKKNTITIPDVNPEVFEKVLQFIYADKVDDLDDYAEELLEVSDKYQLETLKELCEDSIAKTLSIENAIRVLVLADRHNAKQLVEFVLNYIVVDLVSLKNTEKYKALEEFHPSLFFAVLKKHVDGL